MCDRAVKFLNVGSSNRFERLFALNLNWRRFKTKLIAVSDNIDAPVTGFLCDAGMISRRL